MTGGAYELQQQVLLLYMAVEHVVVLQFSLSRGVQQYRCQRMWAVELSPGLAVIPGTSHA